MILNFFKKIFSYVNENRPRLSINKLQVKQALYATVIRACTNCGAPGVDSEGKEVGKFCPECGAKRPKSEPQGRIWVKYKE